MKLNRPPFPASRNVNAAVSLLILFFCFFHVGRYHHVPRFTPSASRPVCELVVPSFSRNGFVRHNVKKVPPCRIAVSEHRRTELWPDVALLDLLRRDFAERVKVRMRLSTVSSLTNLPRRLFFSLYRSLSISPDDDPHRFLS